MIKKIALVDLALVGIALLLLVAAFFKHTLEIHARNSVGGDVSVSRVGAGQDLSIQAFLSMTATKRSEIMTVETKARAQETEERPESRPIPVILKVIDRDYPLSGVLELSNKTRALTFASYAMGKQQGAAASRDLLKRLSLASGETFLIGQTVFIITAVIDDEPDYDKTEEDLPRILISNRAFSALVKQGMYFENPQTFEIRANLKPETDLVAWQQSFDAMFREAGWKSRIWTDSVPAFLLYVKLPFLIITSGILLLIAIVRYERRKQRAHA